MSERVRLCRWVAVCCFWECELSWRFAWRVLEFLGWCELCVVFSALVCVSGVGFVLDWDVSCFVCGGFLVGRAVFRFGGGGCVWVTAFWLDLVWVLVDF